VTSSVVGAIAPKLEAAEIERATRKPTESLDAYDYFLRGMSAFHQTTKETNAEALTMFARAIERDPHYAAAHGMAARCYAQRKGFGWLTEGAHEMAEAERLALRAADLGHDDAVALCAAGFALLLADRVEDGAALIERALALNPNLGWLWIFGGMAKAFLGESEAAIDRATRAMRLSPQDPQMFGMQIIAAWGHFFAGRFDQALSWAESAVREKPNFMLGVCVAAASAGMAGRPAEAQKAMAQLRRLNPALNFANLKDFMPIRRPEEFERWTEGLRKAGLPE
jgi:tetratricopeptide (TPR) repeat protein